jgi:hypothetical protein
MACGTKACFIILPCIGARAGAGAPSRPGRASAVRFGFDTRGFLSSQSRLWPIAARKADSLIFVRSPPSFQVWKLLPARR